MNDSSPILDFDSEPQAILSPRGPKTSEPVPECCVLCFFQDVITQQINEGNLRLIGNLGSEIGPNPVYLLEHQNQRLIFSRCAPASAVFGLPPLASTAATVATMG